MSPLPDYMTPLDEETIRARMLERVPDDIDVAEGSFMYDPIATAAVEFALADDRLRFVFDLGFARTTFGEFLDLRAEEHGVTRKAAVPAKGLVTFTGTAGTTVPAGTDVSTGSAEGGVAQTFTTDAAVTIAVGQTTVVAAVTATNPGAAGNVGPGMVTFTEAVPGITAVTNAAAMTGGVDEESDAALLKRYLDEVREPGTSGNQADYRKWALEIAGVGAAAVVPVESGPGTVTVAILNTLMRAASAPLVAEVQAYIAPGGTNEGTGKAPIGAAVTVQSGVEVAINVVADLTIAAGYTTAAVQAAAAAAVEEYLTSIAFAADNDVRHARVVTAILDTPGITDVQTLTLNGSGTNVAITTKQVAVLGTTTWS